jgi:hypothetical protein
MSNPKWNAEVRVKFCQFLAIFLFPLVRAVPLNNWGAIIILGLMIGPDLHFHFLSA